MSSLYQPRPVLSSQRYSRSPDYLDNGRGVASVGAGRVPLGESTGNVRAHNFNSLVSCYQSPVSLSPSMPPNVQAPMVPSQSFDCLYGVQPARQQPRPQRRSRNSVNPLYFWPAFRQYRNRQAHKDTQKDKGGVWRRPELEDAFVDSVLLMPHMGRRKFSMGGKLHGRNMLISEYIFVLCVELLGSKEIFRIDNSNDSIEQMGRKQVSSHMQVVKKFFEDLRCFHFLFPAEDKKEPGSTNSDDYYDEEEQESFKSNPILTALAESRVPDVKPNYDYFSQLLALQSAITVRPKTCEIFVSSPDVTFRDEVAYDASDNALDQTSFPHLGKYSNSDDGPNVLGKDVLLHEYTRSLDRNTSACVKTVTRKWQKDAPAMYETLDLPARDEDCLLMEMCATLDLHEHAKFPSGSELTGFVEVAITQPGLQNHRWKCVTRLTRPAELHHDDTKQEVYKNESGIHRRGCSDSRPDCDCHARPRQEIHVPFPAVEWASILSMAVQYPDVEHQAAKEKGETKKHDGERSSSKRKRSEDEGDAASWTRRELTGSDLICKVAMYQELWSCAPESQQWKRQCIVFWRFNTANQWYKYNPIFKPAGTTWRWLTMNDPMSRYHQQKALVFPSAPVSRDSIMSPTPSVNQHLTAAMSETFSSAWDNGSGHSNGHNGGGPGGQSHGGLPHVPPIQTANNSMGLFDSFSNGLATPPPSATLHGPYTSNSFDASMGTGGAGVNFLSGGPSSVSERHGSTSSSLGAGHQQQQQPQQPQRHSYYESGGSSAGSAAQATTFADVKPMSAVAHNPYMAATSSLDLSSPLVYDNSGGDVGGLQGWDMSAALDGWTSSSTPASAAAEWGGPPKLETSDHGGMWAPPAWNVPASATVSHARGSSPPPMKRRRASAMDAHVPVTTGW